MSKKPDYRAIAQDHVLRIKDHAFEKDISQTTIAQRMEIEQGTVSRMLSNKHMPNLDTFLELLDAVGLELIIKPIKSK